MGKGSVVVPVQTLGIDKAIGIHQGLMKPIETIVEANGDGIDEKTKVFVKTVASAVAALSIRNTADSFGIDDNIAPEGKQRIDEHNAVINTALKAHETMRNEKESIIEKLQTEIKEHDGITKKTVGNQTEAIKTTEAAMSFFQV
jgi:hypothetical protein